MFTHSCILKTSSEKIIKELMYIGLEKHPDATEFNESSYIYCSDGFFSNKFFGDSEKIRNSIVCDKEDVDLFLAIAALQDDTDCDQWFFYPREDIWFKCDVGDINEERIELMESCQGAWFHCSHKATVDELIDHFK